MFTIVQIFAIAKFCRIRQLDKKGNNMKRMTRYLVAFAATALMSSSALAVSSSVHDGWSDDFESYDLYVGPGYQGDIGGGWLIWADIFGNSYPTDCSVWWYNYWPSLPAPAPNKDGGFSNISTSTFGKALNVFSDYENGNHWDSSGGCIQTSVFQERTFTAADADTYTFQFWMSSPAPVGPGVTTSAYVTVLNPNDNYNAVVFDSIETDYVGLHSLTLTLDAGLDGMILQWGFRTVAGKGEASGRMYDLVSFTPASDIPEYEAFTSNPIPIPRWAMLGMAGLLALFGYSALRRRYQS